MPFTGQPIEPYLYTIGGRGEFLYSRLIQLEFQGLLQAVWNEVSVTTAASHSCSVALLVFLPATAGAGIVAADFVLSPLSRSRSRGRFFAAVQGQLGLWALGDRLRWSRRLLAFMTDGLHVEESLERV